MNWSAEQQRLLHALGHDLMVPGLGVGAALAAMPSGESIAAKVAPTVTSPVVAAHKLADAIRRAAGGNDVSALIDDIGRLRSEPALKRALWPRLRALRRSH